MEMNEDKHLFIQTSYGNGSKFIYRSITYMNTSRRQKKIGLNLNTNMTSSTHHHHSNSNRPIVPLTRPTNLFNQNVRGAVNFSYRPQIDDDELLDRAERRDLPAKFQQSYRQNNRPYQQQRQHSRTKKKKRKLKSKKKNL